MTDAELQEIRERVEEARHSRVLHQVVIWYGKDVPALLEAVDAAEALKGNYYAMAIGLSAYLVDCAWPVRKKMDEELTAAEDEIERLRVALKTIHDYAGDNPAELHVALELLEDIGRVAEKALKPEETSTSRSNHDRR